MNWVSNFHYEACNQAASGSNRCCYFYPRHLSIFEKIQEIHKKLQFCDPWFESNIQLFNHVRDIGRKNRKQFLIINDLVISSRRRCFQCWFESPSPHNLKTAFRRFFVYVDMCRIILILYVVRTIFPFTA